MRCKTVLYVQGITSLVVTVIVFIMLFIPFQSRLNSLRKATISCFSFALIFFLIEVFRT